MGRLRLDEHKRDYLSYFKPPRSEKTFKMAQSPNPGSNPLTPGRSPTPNKSPFARPKTFESDSYGSPLLDFGSRLQRCYPLFLHPCAKGPTLNRLEEWYTLQTKIESDTKNFTLLNNMDVVLFNNFNSCSNWSCFLLLLCSTLSFCFRLLVTSSPVHLKMVHAADRNRSFVITYFCPIVTSREKRDLISWRNN